MHIQLTAGGLYNNINIQMWGIVNGNMNIMYVATSYCNSFD